MNDGHSQSLLAHYTKYLGRARRLAGGGSSGMDRPGKRSLVSGAFQLDPRYTVQLKMDFEVRLADQHHH